MAANQRRLAGRGLPRSAADAGACWSDRAAAGDLPAAQPAGAPRAAGSGVTRSDTDRRQAERTGSNRVPTGAADSRRAAVQQPDGTSSLSGLRATGGFCNILLYLINYLKTLIAVHHG